MSTGWKSHDMSRPRPEVVAPVASNQPVPPPPNAVVLFDGKDLSQWTSANGSPAPWKVENGYFEVAPGTGLIRSKETFGDVQLHVEWASPNPPRGTGQDRGNSGVYLMQRYEVQVLDSYRADTYPDGQAGAIYGQWTPLFNASRAPGEWQTYDVIFRRPRFAADGSLREPARLTLIHNGVVVQNNQAYVGPSSWLKPFPYEAHADALPIELQDHGSPVRFRNFWVVRLPENAPPSPTQATRPATVKLSTAQMDRLVGQYVMPGTDRKFVTITREGDRMFFEIIYRPGALEIVPTSATEFALVDTDARVTFDVDAQGRATGLTFNIGGADIRAERGK